MLTEKEIELVKKIGSLVSDFQAIMTEGTAQEADLAEAIVYIHGLQQMVMSQSAARAHPEHFRLLGGWPKKDE